MSNLQRDLEKLQQLSNKADRAARWARWGMAIAILGGVMQLTAIVLRWYGY